MLREQGGHVVPMTLQLDALSVYAVITALYIKTPAEKSLLSHIQYIRELLDLGILRQVAWIDTRDMASDGLTKGNVERSLLHMIMDGYHKLSHECKVWSPKQLHQEKVRRMQLSIKTSSSTSCQ